MPIGLLASPLSPAATRKAGPSAAGSHKPWGPCGSVQKRAALEGSNGDAEQVAAGASLAPALPPAGLGPPTITDTNQLLPAALPPRCPAALPLQDFAIAAGVFNSSGSGEGDQEPAAVRPAPQAAAAPAPTTSRADAGGAEAAEVEAVCWDASLAAAPTAVTAARTAAFVLAASRVGAAPPVVCRSLAFSDQSSSPTVRCPLAPPAPVLASASPLRSAAQMRSRPPASLPGTRSNLQHPPPTMRFASKC
jgi:hypothetical protein